MSRLHDYEVARAHFNRTFGEHGPTVKALSWGSEASQKKRFKALVEVGDLGGGSILDVGCGFGDLLGFLEEEGVGIAAYLGLDINGNMLAVAKERYPEGRFERRDILSDPPAGPFDYVIASGIFSLDSPTWVDFVHQMLRGMFALAAKGVAVNFLSGYTSGRKFEGSRYPYPSEISDFVAQSLTNRFVLRHDYLSNDFTVYFYREP